MAGLQEPQPHSPRPFWNLSHWTCLFGNHSLTMLRAWAGSFKCLFWASARGFVPQAVKAEKTESSSQWENVHRWLAAYVHVTGICWPPSQPCLVKSSPIKNPSSPGGGEGKEYQVEKLSKWHFISRGLETFEPPLERVCPAKHIFS
jgi:hypothetical protein